MNLQLITLLTWPISAAAFNGFLHPRPLHSNNAQRSLLSNAIQHGTDSTKFFAVPDLLMEHGSLHSITADISRHLDLSSATYNWKTQALNDFSHLMLDLFTFLTPERAILRLANVIGRMSTLAAIQYNHASTTTEEFLFQAAMLVISAALCSRSFPSLSTTWFAESSFRDKAAFMLVFRPIGMSWLQYQTLVTVAGEWITVPPNTIVSETDETSWRNAKGSNSVESDDYLHWLYVGDAEVQADGESIQYIIRSRRKSFQTDDTGDLGLLDPLNFSRILEKQKIAKLRKNRVNVRKDETKVEIKTGRKGATILRLNTRKLLQLMEDDEKVAIAIQGLLLRGLHQRLGTMVSRISEGSCENGKNKHICVVA